MIKIEDLASGRIMHGEIKVKAVVTQLMTKTDKPYLSIRMKDETGVAYANIWLENKMYNSFLNESQLPFEAVFQVSIDESNKTNHLLLKIHNRQDVVLSDTNNTQKLQPQNQDISYFKSQISSIQNQELKTLVINVFRDADLANQYFISPLSILKSSGASHMGGLLEFTNRLLKMIDDNYANIPNDIDVSVLKTVALLEPIGRVKMMNFDNKGNNKKTFEGELLPHPILTMNYLLPYLTQLSHEKMIYLQHLILAVPGNKDWGALVTDRTTEGNILNHLWQLNMQYFHFEKQKELNKGRDFGTIFGRRVYLGNYPNENEVQNFVNYQ